MKKETHGFTLIELLVSAVVIGLTLLTVLLANNHVQRTTEETYERMVATQDAHRVMEGIRDASYQGTFPQNVASTYPNGAAVPGFNNLSNEQVVVTYANPNADPLQVTVTTIWNTRGLRPSSVQVTTLVTQRR